MTMPFEQEAPLARRAGCIKAGDGLAVTIQNPQVAIDLEAAVRPWMKPWNGEHASGRIIRHL